MFAGISVFAERLYEEASISDTPPATPIAFPRYQPIAHEDASVELQDSLSSLLSSTGRRPPRLVATALSAIGLDLSADADLQQLIPDPSLVPDFATWDRMTLEQSQDANESTRRPLSNVRLSPGCHVYLERKTELSNTNADAFRTIRRVQPPMGRQPARLGSAYEFFRQLEQITTYWDDPTNAPSLPPSPEIVANDVAIDVAYDAANNVAIDVAYDAANNVAHDANDAVNYVAVEPSETPSNMAPQAAAQKAPRRTHAGHQMPASLRHTLVATFVKMIAYEFGCTASPSRIEPRLHLHSPRDSSASPRKSYFPSRCQFIFQNPQSREQSRAGLAYGPVAAISCRPDTSFTRPDPESAQSLDLAREVIAALITAQHRARQGKEEERFGFGQWWVTEPRWGGAHGGPIGREIQNDGIAGDKDLPPDTKDDAPELSPPNKKSRRTVYMYDNYRMIRPPAATWDRKVRYISIGKQAGTDYEDIFLISSLFHHLSLLRVRVPLRLLEVLDGAPDPDPTRRSWGIVRAWRTPWYDLFETRDRIKAMQIIWSVMAYQMRADTGWP